MIATQQPSKLEVKGRGNEVPAGTISMYPEYLGEVGGATESRNVTVPPGRWHQRYWKPCSSPTIMCYSTLCCCCAVGDIGCYAHKKPACYPVYCLSALCPCSLGFTRDMMAEKYNLATSILNPEDFTGYLVKFVGFRLFFCITMIFLPAMHITQMRAEVAYRRHGESTLCPCCCFDCANRPDIAETSGTETVDSPCYPVQQQCRHEEKTMNSATPNGAVTRQPMSAPQFGPYPTQRWTPFYPPT